jgi:2-dehydropantoate 2-reductase
MKFAIVGTGAVGGYFGARLAADGNEVLFVARGRNREAMLASGLRVLSPLGDVRIEKPWVFEDPLKAGLCDVVLFCVKLWDSEAAAGLIKPLLAHDTAVVSLQNGVEAEDLLARLLGPQHVLGGAAYIAAELAEPGVVRHTGSTARLVFGERDGSGSWRGDALLSACIGAGIDARMSEAIDREIWKKFVFLAPLAGATALYRCPAGAVMAEPERRTRFAAMVRETAAVGRAKGVGLDAGLERGVLANAESLPKDMKTSMLNDLERGRRLELDWLTGAVVRLGRELGVATPENEAVYDALKPHAMGANP